MNYSKNAGKTTTPPSSKEKPPIVPKNYGTTVKKQSVTDRLVKRIVKTDFETWKNHMIDNVIIPKAITLVRDTIVNSVDMFFYGKTIPNKSGYNGGGYFAYNSVSTPYGGSKNDNFIPAGNSQTRTAAHGYETIVNTVFSSREKAVEFVYDVRARCEQCNGITLLEVLCMMEKPGNFTDDRFGWKNAEDFTESIVYATAGGFAVNMPKMLEFTNR